MIHPLIDSDRPQLVSMEQAEQMVLQERERCAGIARKLGIEAWMDSRLTQETNVRAMFSAQDQIANRIATAIRKGDE